MGQTDRKSPKGTFKILKSPKPFPKKLVSIERVYVSDHFWHTNNYSIKFEGKKRRANSVSAQRKLFSPCTNKVQTSKSFY